MKCSRMPRTWLCKAVCRSDSDPFLKMTFKLIVSHWSSTHTESKGKFPSLWMKERRKSRIRLCKAVRRSDLTMTIKKISSHWSSTPTRWNGDFLLCEWNAAECLGRDYVGLFLGWIRILDIQKLRSDQDLFNYKTDPQSHFFNEYVLLKPEFKQKWEIWNFTNSFVS